MEIKKLIICLRLTFEEIPYQKFWVSCGVLFKGLGVQKDTQTPCWLRPCFVPHFGHAKVYGTSIWTPCFQISAKTL